MPARRSRSAPSPATTAVASAPLLQEHCRSSATRPRDWRSAGSPPRDDRRLARTRRPRIRPARRHVAIGAEMVVRGATVDRTVSASQFFTGVFETAVGPAEMLTEIRVPKLENSAGWAYLKAQPEGSGLGDRGRRRARSAHERIGRERFDRPRRHRSTAITCTSRRGRARERIVDRTRRSTSRAEGTEPPSDSGRIQRLPRPSRHRRRPARTRGSIRTIGVLPARRAIELVLVRMAL